MSKVEIISGVYEEDNLVLIVNSRDSFASVSIDTDSRTDDFIRVTRELSLCEQVKLYKALHANIGKWKEELLTEEK